MLRFPKDKVAITPIRDPDTTTGLPVYTPEETKFLSETGGMKKLNASLIIPDQAKERIDQGIVKYIGPDVKDIKIGMYVIFSGYTGELVRIQGEGDLIVTTERFIVAEIDEVENIYVPGLFYKGRINKAQQQQELYEAIHSYLLDWGPDLNGDDKEVAHGIAKHLSENGFYGPISAPYFEADYENILNFIARAFTESEFIRRIKVNVQKDKWEDEDASI